MDDYEPVLTEEEQKIEDLKIENTKLLFEFGNWLDEEKKLTQKTIKKHIGNVDF